MLRWIIVVLGGCSYAPVRTAPSTDGDIPDSSVAGDAARCVGAGFGALCVTTLPTEPLVLLGTLDTGETNCTEVVVANAVELCVLAGTTVTVENFRAVGTRPLVIVGLQTVTVDTSLSVGSIAGPLPGAGADLVTCAGATAGADNLGGASGGSGGSFGGVGGVGGVGDTNGISIVGGTAASPIAPTSIRAGCPGTAGGAGDVPGGSARPGGGAVYVIAGVEIVVNGSVTAMGRGGAGAGSRGGGGGGGSGGLIGLDAPVVRVDGVLAANGGGGGEGARVQAEIGLDGQDGQIGARASGADDGDINDGAGGAGSEGSVAGGDPGIAAPGGGGGGGGGAGYIYIKGNRQGGGTASPEAVVE